MKTFLEIPLIKPIQRALEEEKYEQPSPIQAQTIPVALEGRDVLGCAQTGTGKTAAFALPILNALGSKNRRAKPNKPLALILAPTRELAIQIGESCAAYGRHLRIRQTLVYGGVNQFKQVRTLKRGVHLLIATPGRLLDLMNQGHISLDQLESFVLDEADRMLDMGFLPDLKRIIRELPDERQSLFFSATLPPKIVELSDELLSDPVRVDVTPEKISVEKIEQRVLYVNQGEKQAVLKKILSEEEVGRTLVFTKTKRGADQLVDRLSDHGIEATSIHGNKSQRARQRALENFRRDRVRVLVATDVAARGIDVDGISHVVNYDLPLEPENYVHRIGRTGRAGAEGIAISFCSSTDRRILQAIERLIEHQVPVDPDYPMPKRSGGRGGSERGDSSRPRRRRNSSRRSRKPETTDGTPSKRRSKPSSAKRKAAAKRRISEKKAKNVRHVRSKSKETA